MEELQPLPDHVDPVLRVANAGFTSGSALRIRSGSLFLFADRITFVSSRGATAFFGVIGLLSGERGV